MTRQQIKTMAREQIRGKVLGTLFRISLFIYLIMLAAELAGALVHPIVGMVLSLLLVPAFTVSNIRIYRKLTFGIYPQNRDMFVGFYNYVSAVATYYLSLVLTLAWRLLLIVPGIIKGLGYTFSMYVAAEHPEISPIEALRRSEKMMKGHKMELFVLMLSFIGWMVLAPFTLGILYIWLIPYMQASLVNFYNSIKPDPEAEENAEEQGAEW